MKNLFFCLFFYLLSPLAYGEKKPDVQPKTNVKAKKTKKSTDQSLIKNKTSSKSPGIVTKQIKTVFEDFLKILENEIVESNEYTKAVRFLEGSLYNEASFETLKLLAEVYEKKGDFKNQINVLNILSTNYSTQAESFYLLGMAYKNLSLNEKDKKDKEENKKKSIDNFNQALKINPKYTSAYKSLLDLLMDEDPETKEKIHTKESLNVVMSMVKNLRKNKYYIQLCKAYYDKKFFKQSRKACAKSVKRNPKDPISPLILALSYPLTKNTGQKLIKIAEKFKKSFFVQYRTAVYFMDKDPKSAIAYLDSAHALKPENVHLNQVMAQFLFDNKAEEKSYKHFMKACQLTKGAFLGKFRKAKSMLRRKQMLDLGLKFQKGIEQCFLEAKKNKKPKK